MMQRTITVVSAATAACVDVCVDGTNGRVLADVLPELAALTGAPTTPATRGGEILDSRTPIAHLHDGDVVVLGAPPALPPMPTAGCVVEVVAGPDAGRRVRLDEGHHLLGRDQPPLCARDTTVSRPHVEVTVSDTVTVCDLGSANGTFLDGDRLASVSTTWPPGVPLQIGACVLVHGRAPAAAAAVTAAPDGTVSLNRPPRLTPEHRPATVTFPGAAEPSPVRTRFPVLATLAPLVAGIGLAVLLRRWEFLAFALMSPLVTLGQAVSDRLAARRDRRRAEAAHALATAAAQRELASALAAERVARHAAAPDLARLVADATLRTTRLWERGADDDHALVLRIGRGDTAAATTTVAGPQALTVHDVPLTLDLRKFRVVGITGELAREVAQSLLLQAVVLHGPAALRVAVLAPRQSESWRWCRWLPHLRQRPTCVTPAALAVDTEQVPAVLEEWPVTNDSSHRLVVVDGVDPSLATRLAAHSTIQVWVAESPGLLPPGCDAVVTTRRDSTPQVVVSCRGELPVHGTADLVPYDVAEEVARSLAPMRDVHLASTAVPDVVAWSQVQDLALHDVERAARALRQRWSRGPSTTVPVGVGASGVVTLDLRTDGPHALVAGTTGAGKSELLRSLVASLVAGNSPRDLRLLLVDFKGGTAFGGFDTLPHTLDVLTDLDPAATSRALRALTAELRRREGLLAAAGAADVDEWRAQTARQGTAATLPRLVIVVDEFATLADELPDFLGGLVAIAQRGRALGVHLVLATQRPEGAVSADVRANTRLRICLAVAREAESRDVIDSPRAVDISRATPGRALIRVGGHDLVDVQSARVSAPVAKSAAAVTVVPLLTWADQPPTAPVGPQTATELDVLVDAARRAAEPMGVDETPLWLPPLPTSARLSLLPSSDPGQVAVGVVDLPDEQRQPPLRLSTDSAAPLLLVGTARSGRTTAATTVVTALAGAHSPDGLHVYVIDSGRALTRLSSLPHTGAVVDAGDVDRVERMLLFLTSQVQSRRGDAGTDRARLLLVVDSWDGLLATAGDADAARLQELLLRLIADGPGAGLRVVVTSDRSGIMGKLASSIADRICLRLADPGDYAAIGLPARQAPRDLPPGRGIRAADLAYVQLATPDDESWAKALHWPSPRHHAPRRFDPLPVRVPLHEVRRHAAAGVVIGVRGDDLAPVVVDPASAAGTFLVAGPPRSGRSTALLNIATQLQPRRVVALCGRRGSALRPRADLAAIRDASIPADVVAAVEAAAQGATLLVDDVDLIDDIAAMTQLEDAVRRARDGAGFVVLAGTTEAMTVAFRGPVAQARRGRAGLLLRPEGSHDGELLGLRLRRRSAHADPPGRGLLAVDGAVVPVQVPDPT